MVDIAPDLINKLDALVRARAPRLFEACPGCGQIRWGFNPTIWDLEPYRGSVVAGTRQVYPVLVIECFVCAYVHLVAAKSIGLLNAQGDLALV